MTRAIGEVVMKLSDGERTVNVRGTAAMPKNEGEGAAREQQSLRALIEHIVQSHHVFTRDAVAKIEDALPSVIDAHAKEHPEIIAVARGARALCDDLLPHLMREERVLFPWIEAAEASRDRGVAPPPAHFGTVKNPIRVMDHDHDVVQSLLSELRASTKEYDAPEWASAPCRELYRLLQALDSDLREHIHWESDVLFVRALSLEA